MNLHRAFALGLLVGLPAWGCASPSLARPTSEETRSLARTIRELYDAFGFEAGGQADWMTMSALFADGAVFVAPGDKKGVDEERFLGDFQEYCTTSPYARTGLHERVLCIRADVYGSIAHAYVSFEGHVPGEEQARTRGLDSLQFVRDGPRWLLVSFTTQYERSGLPMPARFL